MGTKGRRWIATRAREAYWVAKRGEAGRLQAQVEAQRVKPLDISLKEHLGKFIDRMSEESVIKLAGWGALTLIVHTTLVGAEAIMAKIGERGNAWNYHMSSLQAFFDVAEVGLPKEAIASMAPNDIGLWLLSAGIAALIIQFGPAIIESVGGVAKLGLLLLA